MGLWKRLRRPDWLAEMQQLLVVGVVLVGLGGLVQLALIAFGSAIQATVPTQVLLGEGPVPGAQPGVSFDRWGDLGIVVEHPSVGQRTACVLTGAPTLVLVLVLLAMLLQIVRNARRSDPFTRLTVRRLRVLAVTVLVGGEVAVIVETIAHFQLSDSVTYPIAGVHVGYAATLELPVVWLFVGFGFLAIAEVVKRGCAMRAELDEVI